MNAGEIPELDRILDGVATRLRSGEPLDLEALVAAHPAHASDLRRLVPVMSLLEGAGSLREVAHRAAPEAAQEIVGPYTVIRELGRGGMGRVLACEAPDGSRVAVKVIHPHLLGEARHRERFLNEARVGERVQHPSLVRTLASGVAPLGDDESPYIVLEYVEGQSLRALLDEVGTVPERLVCLIGQRVAAGLAHLHEAGVVHRDIKPENIVITGDETVKLMDLGVAFLADQVERISRTGEFVGSLLYAAPEQLRGAAPEPAADLYALGLVLFELVTGEHPMRGISGARAAADEAPSASARRPDVSAFLDALLRALLEPEPETRLDSAAGLGVILAERERSAWWRARADKAALRSRRLQVDDWVAFQGREAELARLQSLFDQTRTARRGQALLIEGEGGVGKSRLVAEWLRTLEARPDAPHIGLATYSPGATTLAAPPLEDALRGLVPLQGMRARLDALLGKETRLADIAQRYLEPAADPDLLQVPAVARAAIYERILVALASEKPLVFVMEDLHFGGEAAWTLFQTFARTLPAEGVLLVGTTRPGAAPAALDEMVKNPHASHLVLEGLEAPAIRALLRDALGEHAARTTHAHDLARISDGSPFCVLEFAREVRRREAGALRGGRAFGAPPFELPASVRALVDARLAALDPEARELLALAACAGERWDPEVICATLDVPRLRGLRLFLRLDREHGLIRPDGESYRFRHHLVQEALYEELTPALKRGYHGALADALRQDLVADAPLDRVSAYALARHRLLADQIEAAVPYLRAGLEYLEHAGEFVRAESMARRIDAEGTRVPATLHAFTLLVLGRTLADRSPREACALYERGLDRVPSDDVRLRAQLARCLAEGRARTGEMEAALTSAVEALQLARASGDPGLIGSAHAQHATVLLRAGQGDAARAEATAGLARAREDGNPWQLASTCVSTGEIEVALGEVGAARALAEEAYDLAKTHLDRRIELASLHLLGKATRMQGRLTEAIGTLERARELARATGSVRREAASWLTRNILLHEVGRTAEAIAEGESACAFLEGAGQPDLACYATMMLGCAHAVRGQMAEAEPLFEAASVRADELGQDLLAQKVGIHHAGLLLYTGRLETSRALGAAVARGGATDADDAALLHLRAITHEAAGEFSQAYALLRDTLDAARDAKPYNTMRLRLVAARMALRAGQTDAARELLAEVLPVARDLDLRPAVAMALVLRGALPDMNLLPVRVALEDHSAAMGAVERILATRLAGVLRDDEELRARAARDLEAYVAGLPEALRQATRESRIFAGEVCRLS